MGRGRDEAHEDFDAWYGREAPRVLASVTLAVGDRWLAEEATAEAFARALERWPAVREARSPSAWVYTVALNQVRSAARRRQVERRFLHRQRPDVAHPAPPPDVALWRAVGELPPRMRTVVALRYVGDLPQAQIAEVLGVTPGTVASTLHDARAKLAERLAHTHGGTR
jgi:RNA polymerase sigma-70 factor (ECF subfamily)